MLINVYHVKGLAMHATVGNVKIDNSFALVLTSNSHNRKQKVLLWCKTERKTLHRK